MKTKIVFSGIIMILLLHLFLTIASGAMKIEIGSKGQISGYIRNASLGQPLKNVSVTVYSAADSLMVAGTITNGDGSFVISMLTSGSYILEISYPGFIKRSIPELIVRKEYPGVDMGEIQLFPDETAVKRKRLKKQQMLAGI
jgi:5-hydroxyisourate hydrolase-like protein (transthyretin family)